MVELHLHCPQHEVETISDALMALDALSVSVQDADAHTDQEQALFGEPGMPPPAAGWARSEVVALFADDAAAADKDDDFTFDFNVSVFFTLLVGGC